MSDAILFKEVSVRYDGRDVVGPLSLAVPAGSVYAILGRNGAGKTSLVRALTGLLRPSHGSVTVAGRDAWCDRASVMQHVGVVPEDPDIPPTMTPLEVIAFCARLYREFDGSSVRARFDRFGIPLRTPFGNLSKGQKRQVSLALTLAARPDILVLDDPTLGLDVVARKELFEELIGELADRNVTMLIATHDLAGIESIADRAGILRQGKLILDEEIETLKQRFRRIRFSDAARVSEEMRDLTIVKSQTLGSGVEAIVAGFDERRIESFRGSRPDTHVDVVPMSLEDIFLAVDDAGGELA